MEKQPDNRKMDIIRPKASAPRPVAKPAQPTEPTPPDKAEQRNRLRQLIISERQKERQKSRPLKIGLLVMATLAIISLVVGVLLYNHAQYLASPEGIAAEQQARVNRLVEKVSQLTDLPDESPLAITISDIDKLSGQPFFGQARNGDVVLIYETSQRGIIYREAENRIINDRPITDSAVL